MSFFEENHQDRLYYVSNIFDNTHITSAFTTSKGGVSHGNITGFNLGFRVNDDKDSVLGNYRLLAKDLRFDLSRAVLSKQTHTDNIRIVAEEDCGKGVLRQSDIEDTDGLITDIKNIPLIIFAADCTPILFFDEANRVIGAVHAGWRGTVKEIAPKCVELMKEHFNSNPSDIKVAIGPSIGPCCFEFGSEASSIFSNKYITPVKSEKFMVDIWKLNFDLLLKSGIKPENIDTAKICTACNSDIFYSYRTHKQKTGRQSAVIMLKG